MRFVSVFLVAVSVVGPTLQTRLEKINYDPNPLNLTLGHPWISSTQGSYNCTVQGWTLDQGGTKMSYKVCRPSTSLCTAFYVLPFVDSGFRNHEYINIEKQKHHIHQAHAITTHEILQLTNATTQQHKIVALQTTQTTQHKDRQYCILVLHYHIPLDNHD